MFEFELMILWAVNLTILATMVGIHMVCELACVFSGFISNQEKQNKDPAKIYDRYLCPGIWSTFVRNDLLRVGRLDLSSNQWDRRDSNVAGESKNSEFESFSISMKD